MWRAFVDSHLGMALFAAKLVAPSRYLDALFIQAFSVCDMAGVTHFAGDDETIMAANHDSGIRKVKRVIPSSRKSIGQPWEAG
jgi:hypothetical protein